MPGELVDLIVDIAEELLPHYESDWVDHDELIFPHTTRSDDFFDSVHKFFYNTLYILYDFKQILDSNSRHGFEDFCVDFMGFRHELVQFQTFFDDTFAETCAEMIEQGFEEGALLYCTQTSILFESLEEDFKLMKEFWERARRYNTIRQSERDRLARAGIWARTQDVRTVLQTIRQNDMQREYQDHLEQQNFIVDILWPLIQSIDDAITDTAANTPNSGNEHFQVIDMARHERWNRGEMRQQEQRLRQLEQQQEIFERVFQAMGIGESEVPEVEIGQAQRMEIHQVSVRPNEARQESQSFSSNEYTRDYTPLQTSMYRLQQATLGRSPRQSLPPTGMASTTNGMTQTADLGLDSRNQSAPEFITRAVSNDAGRHHSGHDLTIAPVTLPWPLPPALRTLLPSPNQYEQQRQERQRQRSQEHSRLINQSPPRTPPQEASVLYSPSASLSMQSLEATPPYLDPSSNVPNRASTATRVDDTRAQSRWRSWESELLLAARREEHSQVSKNLHSEDQEMRKLMVGPRQLEREVRGGNVPRREVEYYAGYLPEYYNPPDYLARRTS